MSLTWNDVLVMLIPAFLIMVSGGAYIRFLKARYLGQYIREDGPERHQSKAGTPTMGGVLIVLGVTIGLLVAWGIYGSQVIVREVWLAYGTMLILGLLGFTDDYLKIVKKKNKGVSGYTKLAIQTVVGLLVGFYVMSEMDRTSVDIFGQWTLELGWVYPVFAMLVISGASNAVNLTDGLDGLASGTAIMSFMALTVILMASAMVLPSPLIASMYIGLGILAWLLLSACSGFLFYNAHPAKIFMGDTGSLAIGGALGTLAVLAGVEMWLLLIGGIFVLEALSVIIQVISFKTTGKRIFKMSPLHHHFELSGFSETQVVYYFVGLQFVLCTVAVFLYNKAL